MLSRSLSSVLSPSYVSSTLGLRLRLLSYGKNEVRHERLSCNFSTVLFPHRPKMTTLSLSGFELFAKRRSFSSSSSSSSHMGASAKKRAATIESLREVAAKVKSYKNNNSSGSSKFNVSDVSSFTNTKPSSHRKEETALERVTDLNAQGFEYMRVKMYAEAENNFREAILLLPSVHLGSEKGSSHNNTPSLDQIEDPEVALLGASLLNNLGMACAEQFFALDPKTQQEQREQRLRRLAAQHKQRQQQMQSKRRREIQKGDNAKVDEAREEEGEARKEEGEEEESLSKFDDAVEFLQEALDIRTVHRGLLHTETLTVFSNLGLLFQKQKEYHIALSYYEKASDALDELLKCLEELETKVYNNQVSVASKSNKHHTRATKAIESVLGDHKTSAATEEEIASSLSEIDLVSLEDQIVKARKLQAVVLNNAAVSFCKLADNSDKEMEQIQEQKGAKSQHQDSEQHQQQRQRQLRIQIDDGNSEDFHENERESYEADAIRCWKKSLELFERKGSLKLAADALNADYVTALRNLGALYLKRKELEESSSLFNKLLDLQQEEFGNSNVKLIPTLVSLADVSLSRYNQNKDVSELNKAKNLVQKAFDIESIYLPERKANSNIKKKLSELEKLLRAK
eukprot:TRINITY_DN1138_c0_g1_i3.p1 TRINITY_DN1138_c0_g1~~TRINITY_DN1138_c0_g1_i3.p1  ORF type:complete len:628 (+),score=212.27 TRINITY_DN1138_c0_g1_i3:140-2023(+)